MASHTVLAPTLAGHANGPPLPGGSGSALERIVEEACGQLDAAGIESAHLVGNSLGGWVALELARRGRARSVLAFSPAGAWNWAVDLQRMLMIFRISAMLRRSKVLPRLAANPRSRRVLMRSMAEHADRLTVAQTAAIFEDMAKCDVLAEPIGGARQSGPIKTLSADCPIRIVWGNAGQDPAVHPLRATAARCGAGGGAGDAGRRRHVPMIDDPAAVAAAILRFIEDVAPQSETHLI
jgi:pimeloyl-ACP methyl ester carboxylesterase